MDGRPILSAAQFLLLEDPGKESQHKFTKLSISPTDWEKGRKTNRAHRHQKEIILDSVTLGWCPFPAIPLTDLQLCYKSGIRSWVLRLFPPALQQRKGGSFTQNALAWGRTCGTNQREQDPEELCLPQNLAPQHPGCAVHMENMQAGKCLLALAPFMFWTIIFCISTS